MGLRDIKSEPGGRVEGPEILFAAQNVILLGRDGGRTKKSIVREWQLWVFVLKWS